MGRGIIGNKILFHRNIWQQKQNSLLSPAGSLVLKSTPFATASRINTLMKTTPIAADLKFSLVYSYSAKIDHDQ